MRDSTYTDSSGITLYLTPSLRAYDAGMIAVGTTLLQIPPGRERYTASSTCSSECTSQFQQGNINIIGAMNHMHYLGKKYIFLGKEFFILKGFDWHCIEQAFN